jgi:hypothetical protein
VLAITRRGEQAVDDFLKGFWRFVGEEGVKLRQRRRQSDEVKRNAPEHSPAFNASMTCSLPFIFYFIVLIVSAAMTQPVWFQMNTNRHPSTIGAIEKIKMSATETHSQHAKLCRLAMAQGLHDPATRT